ncbi:hypothetical protein JHD49_11115, partial [Sulfurimonas sp. SAG-AH-194-C21]
MSVTPDDVSNDTKIEIHVTPYEIQTLKKEYIQKYEKQMSQETLDLYVQNAYRKKVLLEESTRLDLHKNDSIVANRLVSKMEFILLGSVEYKEPSEKELYEYYRANIDEYSAVKSLSFSHIYFSNSINNKNELYTMLNLRKHKTQGIEKLGDTFKGSSTYKNISYTEVE